MEKKNVLIKALIGILIVAASILVLGGFVFGKDMMYHLKERGKLGPLTRENIAYQTVEKPEATSKDGTINAKDWEKAFPNIVATMGANKNHYTITSYLEKDPYLKNIYEGYGFAKDYGSARGHEFTLEDVANTGRPHLKANCLTCKTPNFAKLVNDQGISVYSMPFDEVMALMEENVSCYTCHGNEPGEAGKIVITHSYVEKALGNNQYDIDPATLSCGQCHIEYYFDPETSETRMPYYNVAEMTPDAILAFYDSIDYADWTQESTGARLLKAQHPEMETFLSGKHAALLNCADCHMPIEMAEDGTVYHSHELLSPLKNETLLATCARCHEDTDMVNLVRRLQERVTTRETEVGNKLSGFKDALADAVSAGKLPEATLDEVRKLYREAQWYFDYCYVENSEGAHNSELAFYCLDKSDTLIGEGLAKLGLDK